MRNKNFIKFLFLWNIQTKKELVGFDLYSLLIQPIQRIPRYRLLFEELLKNTPEFHPDYEPMSKTLQSIQDVSFN